MHLSDFMPRHCFGQVADGWLEDKLMQHTDSAGMGLYSLRLFNATDSLRSFLPTFIGFKMHKVYVEVNIQVSHRCDNSLSTLSSCFCAAWSHGDPRKLLHPTDSQGQVCGQKGTSNE